MFAFTSCAGDDPAVAARWQALWQDSPQRTAFSSIEYVTRAAEVYGLRTTIHLASRNGLDEAGLVTCWQRRPRQKQMVIPPFTQYSALVLRKAPSEAVVHRREAPLEALLNTLESTYSQGYLLAEVADPRPAQWRQWRVSPLFTYRLAPGAGMDGWSAAARGTYRKYRTQFEVMESPDAAEQIVALCASSYARHKRKLPARPASLVRLIDALGDHVRCFVALRHGRKRPEAGIAVLHDRRTAHYWVAGSLPGPSMTVLLGHVLPRLHAADIATFDFVGANTASIAEFKRRFGGTLTQYYAISRRA